MMGDDSMHLGPKTDLTSSSTYMKLSKYSARRIFKGKFVTIRKVIHGRPSRGKARISLVGELPVAKTLRSSS